MGRPIAFRIVTCGLPPGPCHLTCQYEMFTDFHLDSEMKLKGVFTDMTQYREQDENAVSRAEASSEIIIQIRL